MKTLGSIIIGFILLIGLAMGVDRYTTNSSHDLISYIDKVENAIHNNQWEQAKKDLSLMKKRWETTHTIWSIFLNHQEIENIDESISRLNLYLDHQAILESTSELSALRGFVDHIADSEVFSLTNIL